MKRSAGNFFEYFFVSGSSNQRVDYKYGNQNVTKNFPVVCHGYVKYEESEVYRSAIMQDFRDNEKKNGRLAAILDFISAKFYMGYPCETLHFVLNAWSSYFAIFLCYVNIIKILKFKMAGKRLIN